MQFTTGIALSLLATYAAAETFNKFPKDDLTCETKTGSETVPLDEIKATVRDGKEETPYESSAANIATSSQCSSQKLPFFYTGLGEGLSITFTYDESTDTYTMCGVDSGDLNGDGYPDPCA